MLLVGSRGVIRQVRALHCRRHESSREPDIDTIDPSRRHFIAGIAAGTVTAAIAKPAGAWAVEGPAPPAGVSPEELAREEGFWQDVASFYDVNDAIVNLEHGYWGKMAKPVQAAYVEALEMVNTENSVYARKRFDDDNAEATGRIAAALGAHDDEIVITRNATEAFQSLLAQYWGLEQGDAILFADIDYPAFKSHMRGSHDGLDLRLIEIELPSRADQAGILDAYIAAFDAHPEVKLALVTHVSNQHGLVVPVAEIAAAARRRCIDIICDAAQSWGLLDYRVADLGVDWAAFNLHKWIGAPLGTGALYMRRGTLDRIAPHPADNDRNATTVASRIHSGTVNFAARLAIPAALDFHEAVGPANKEARLRYLRGLWTGDAERMPHIDVLGGADEASWTGIGAFRLAGQTSIEDAERLQKRLETEFGLFTVVRRGLAGGACVRVTPQVFNSADDLGRLADAMRRLAA